MKAKTLEGAVMCAVGEVGEFSPELAAMCGYLWCDAQDGDATARRIVSAIIEKLPHLGPLLWGPK